MALIRSAAWARPRGAILGQLGSSITATVAATLIVTGVQHEMAVFRHERPMTQLTSGGKFAARVEALRASSNDVDDAVPAAPRVPLLVADTSLQALPIRLSGHEGVVESRPAPEAVRPAKHAARPESRHRAIADAAVDVVPPRRSENIVAAAATNATVETASDNGGVWATTKGLYRQAVWVGGSVLDHVNPLNFLP